MTMLANLASSYTPGNVWALQKAYKDSDYIHYYGCGCAPPDSNADGINSTKVQNPQRYNGAHSA